MGRKRCMPLLTPAAMQITTSNNNRCNYGCCSAPRESCLNVYGYVAQTTNVHNHITFPCYLFFFPLRSIGADSVLNKFLLIYPT